MAVSESTAKMLRGNARSAECFNDANEASKRAAELKSCGSKNVRISKQADHKRKDGSTAYFYMVRCDA